MPRRRKILWVLLVLVLGVLAGMWRFFGSGTVLYSDPGKARTHSPYATAHWTHAAGQEKSKEPAAMPEGFFERFEFRESSNEFFVTMPVLPVDAPKHGVTTRTQQADASNVVRTEGGGTVRLAFVGSLHSVPLRTLSPAALARTLKVPPGPSAKGEAPLRLFRADLNSATEEDLQRTLPALAGHRASLRMSEHYPASRFYFAHSNVPALKPVNIQVFDRRTQWLLSGGGGPAGSEDGVFWFDVKVHAWHQTPLELAVTIETGPVEERTVKLEPGAELEFSQAQLRVAALRTNVLSVRRSERDGPAETMRLVPDERLASSAGPGCTVLLQVWPGGEFPGEIQFLDAQGKEIRREGSLTIRNLSVFWLPADLQGVRSLRVRYRPQVQRMIFRLPELPGLPEENRAVRNLFDVRVPYAHFRDEYQFQRDVKDWLQMQAIHFPLSYPNGFFPLERTNTNVRELFLEMDDLLRNADAQLIADPVSNTIGLRKPPAKEMLRRLKLRLGM